MLGRLSGFDRGRTAERAALACCGVLAALALWLLVRLVWALVPRADDTLGPGPMRAADAPTGAASAPSIARWHLFGDTPLRPGMGAGAPATTLSLILRGTFAGADPETGIAVISDAGMGERAYRTGEDVQPGVRLGEVHADHVVLLRDGARETLTLPRESNLAPADVVRATPASVTRGAAPMAPASARAGGAVSANVAAQDARASDEWQQTVAHLRQNPDELMQRVQVMPVLEGGKLAGVRLSASGADAALLSRSGLLPGDVVTAVNGMQVDSLARGQQIMATLGDAQTVRVTVQRNGSPTDITVGLQ